MSRLARHTLLLALCALALSASPLEAQVQVQMRQKSPAVGDTVKGIFVGEWLRNAPEGGEAFDGRPVLLEFWATWCKPCIAAIPHLNELQEALGGELHFVSITQERKGTVEPVLDKLGMRSAVALDTEQGTTHKVFGAWVIPRTYILSPDRVVLWTGHPTRLTVEKIREIVGK